MLNNVVTSSTSNVASSDFEPLIKRTYTDVSNVTKLQTAAAAITAIQSSLAIGKHTGVGGGGGADVAQSKQPVVKQEAL